MKLYVNFIAIVCIFFRIYFLVCLDYLNRFSVSQFIASIEQFLKLVYRLWLEFDFWTSVFDIN